MTATLTDNSKPRYWMMRTDRTEAGELTRELDAGRLRQGWGWEGADLRSLRAAIENGEQLDSVEADVLRRNRRLLVGEPDAVSVGDRIVLPHLPDAGLWSIVEVTGGYRFEPLPSTDDHGHIIDVAVLQRAVSPRHELVPAGFRRGMKYRGRFRCLDGYGEAIEQLISAPDARVESTHAERVASITEAAEAALFERLTDRYEGADFERPIRLLLKAIFRAEPEWVAGPTECGADLLCTYSDALGTPHVLVAQVKSWTGTNDAGLFHALDQIEQACHKYEGVTSGAVITLLDGFGAEVATRCEYLSQRDVLGIPIRVLCRRELVSLLFQYLPQLSDEPGWV